MTKSYLSEWEAELREQQQALKIAKRLEKLKNRKSFKDTKFGRACAMAALGTCKPFLSLHEKTLNWLSSNPQQEAEEDLKKILEATAQLNSSDEQAQEMANNLARAFLTQDMSDENREKVKEEIKRVRPEPPKEDMIPELN